MPTTYLTVAIPYVNAEPHLGYAYELVAADIHARARRLAGHDVRFLGGTDDNALKNVLAAEAAGVAVRELVDTNASRFERLRDELSISFDDFIRTSADERHRPAVERLWRAVDDAGDLYRHRFEGHYCVGCEDFYTAAELDPEGRCPEHQLPAERVDEQNWFFRLSRYQDQLQSLIEDDTIEVRPEAFRRELLGFIRGGLHDISVSRSAVRARGWGVAVPGDPSQVVYVWFDALTNYLSALGYGQGSPDVDRWWHGADERTHVIGKGILRFHAVYWPAFLLSAGLPTPTRIQVHPYLTADGNKLSKSSGHVIAPADALQLAGVDGLRWWFAREVAEVRDTDVTTERVVEGANADLANRIGNLVNRIVTLVHRHRGGVVPAAPTAARACLAPQSSDQLEERAFGLVADFQLRRASASIVDAATELNRRLDAEAPWSWADHPDRTTELDRLLAELVAGARSVAAALAPIAPALSTRAARQLGSGGPQLPPPAPVFARIDTAVTDG